MVNKLCIPHKCSIRFSSYFDNIFIRCTKQEVRTIWESGKYNYEAFNMAGKKSSGSFRSDGDCSNHTVIIYSNK